MTNRKLVYLKSGSPDSHSDVLSKIIRSDYNLALKIINAVPTGVSIAVDASCKDIRHNAIAAEFFRIKPWESLSASSDKKPPAQAFYKGKLLAPNEMPIQLAAWQGIEVRNMECEFVWDDGVRKTSVWSVSPVFGNNGEIIGAVGTFDDITEKRRLELELAEANKKLFEQEWNNYIDAINCVADPFCILDSLCRFKYVSPKYASFYRKTPEQLLGKSYWAVFPELIDSTFFVYCYKALTEQEAVHFEFKAVYSDAWFENHFHPFQGGMIAYCRDITQRKLAEFELESSRRETIDILESIGDCFISLDDRLRYTFINSAAEDFIGRSKESLIGKHVSEGLGASPIGLAKLTQTWKEKTQQHFELYLGVFQKWVEFSIYPANKGVSIYFRDISKRKQVEEELRQSEERFQTIFHSSPDMIIIFGAEDYEIFEVNQKFVDILGFSREELIGHSLFDFNLISEKDKQLEVDRHLPEMPLFNYELELTTKTGEKITTLVSCDRINIDGETCHLALIKNITDEKKLETKIARLNQLHLIGEMAAGIGHEVRNPMTTVRGFLQLFGEQDEFSKYKDRLDLMIEELDRANEIITEFLTLARNKSSVQKKQQLNKIIEAIFPLLQADAIKNDKALTLELGDLPELMLDEKEIRQVIHNLVRNGLEAIEPRQSVTIKTFTEGEDAILAVSDQGTGMEPQVLGKLGTPFFTTKDTGTGLGLPVCFSIAERHKASIDIEPSPRGTTVFVRFKSNRTEIT